MKYQRGLYPLTVQMGRFQPKEGKSSAEEKLNRRNFQEKLKISKKKFASFLDSQVENNKTVGEVSKQRIIKPLVSVHNILASK